MRALRLTLTTLLVLASLWVAGHWLVNQWRYAHGLVRADALTYLNFARNLSEGSYTVNSPLADLTETHQPRDAAGRPNPDGAKWNWTVRADGKTVYTTAIGYPLFQSAVIKVGGTKAALLANVVLWGGVFLCIFLLLREGLARAHPAGVATIAASTALLAIPWIDGAIQIMVEPWREPLFLFCLTAAAWLLMRFWRTGGLLSACAMAFLLGYACSTKEANVVYLPAYALLFLTAPALWRNQKEKTKRPPGPILTRLLLPACCGLLGLAPFFTHNIQSTGHPLMSPQTLRATGGKVAAAPPPAQVEAKMQLPTVGKTKSKSANDWQPAADRTVRPGSASLEGELSDTLEGESPTSREPSKRGSRTAPPPSKENTGTKTDMKRGLQPSVQYQMAHHYWYQVRLFAGGKFWFHWGWFGLAMLGMLWLLRGRITIWELLGAVLLTTGYVLWGYLELWLWRYDPVTLQPGVRNTFQERRIVSWALTLGTWLVLALVTRRRLGAFLLAFVLCHFSLYLSWASMDFRHMVAVMVVYAMCLGLGAFALTQWLGSVFKVAEAWRPLLVLPVVVAALALAVNWRPLGEAKKSDVFNIDRALTFGEDLNALMNPGATSANPDQPASAKRPVLLGNRFLCEVAEMYTDAHVMRLQEVNRLSSPSNDCGSLLAEMETMGHALYFLDSRDLDPKNVERMADFSAIDRRLIRWRYDLEKVGEIRPADYKLFFADERERVPMYRLRQQTRTNASVALTVPSDGAAFLKYQEYGPYSGNQLALGGQTLKRPDGFQQYLPLNTFTNLPPPGETVRLDVSGTAVPDPTDAAKLVGWNEVIRFPPRVRPPAGAASLGETAAMFGFVDFKEPEGKVIEVPVRAATNGFSVISLDITPMTYRPKINLQREGITVNPSNEVFRVRSIDEPNVQWNRSAHLGGGSFAWWPKPPTASGQSQTNWAGVTRLRLGPISDELFPRLHSIRSDFARTKLLIPTDERSTLLVLYGRLAANDPDKEKGAYTMKLNGEVVNEGPCYADPRRSVNQVRKVFPVPAPGEPIIIEFEGAGLIESDPVLIRDRLEIPFGPRMQAFGEAFFQPPRDGFIWTQPEFRLPVPVIPGKWRYTLSIEGANGEPDGQRRPVTVRLGDQQKEIELSDDPEEMDVRHITFESVQSDASELRELRINIPAWSPKERAQRLNAKDPAPHKDDRQLGFMLKRLVWELAWR